MHMAIHPREPGFHSLRSFIFNVKRLGVCGWLRCAAINAFNRIRGR
jgi:hypothetical protein